MTAEAGREPWEFRAELAERAMIFAGLMPNIKGPEAGQRLRLMPWQQLVFAKTCRLPSATIASHKTSEVYDVLLTAMGKRRHPLLPPISTATGNNTDIGKQL